MTQKKRAIVGKVPCFRCETLADVRQGKIGFLYTHCRICGDNFSRSADFQHKIWSLTEFTVEDDALNLTDKPSGMPLKKYIFEKITAESEEKTQKQETAQRTEQQPTLTKQKLDDVKRVTEQDNPKLSAIIDNNVLLCKEENEEKTDFIECDEVEESSTGRALLGLGGVSCLGFFLWKLFV